MTNIKNKYEPDYMLANLDRVMRQLRRRPKGLSHSARGTYRLLRKISELPGLSTRELAQLMDIRQASLNEKLVRLEKEEMIKRVRDKKDKRIHLVYILPTGMDYLKRSREIPTRINDAIKTIFTSAEIQEFTSLAGKLAAGLEEIASESEIENEKIKDREVTFNAE